MTGTLSRASGPVQRRRPPEHQVTGAGRSRRDEHLAAQHERIDAPIDVHDVWRIASKGYPLGEAYEAVVRRNQRITVGYADLSGRLAEAIADSSADLDANWCTFASWSSHTIGLALAGLTHRQGFAEVDPEPGDERTGLERVPLVRNLLGAAARRKAASLRAVAAGNRAVFLEIGVAVATFLEHFEDRTALDREAHGQSWADRHELFGEPHLEDCWEREWDECWHEIESHVRRVARLDLSWVLPPDQPLDELRRGMRHYLLALRTDDRQLRAEHVLTANILIAAYEQRRVQGYIAAGLALFTRHAIHRLVRHRTGDLGHLRRLPTRLFAKFLTWRMKLQLAGETVRLFDPIPALPPATTAAPAAEPEVRRNGSGAQPSPVTPSCRCLCCRPSSTCSRCPTNARPTAAPVSGSTTRTGCARSSSSSGPGSSSGPSSTRPSTPARRTRSCPRPSRQGQPRCGDGPGEAVPAPARVGGCSCRPGPARLIAGTQNLICDGVTRSTTRRSSGWAPTCASRTLPGSKARTRPRSPTRSSP